MVITLNSKKKGFTLVEMIIVLAITVIISGVIFTIFFTNTKILTSTEIKSDISNEKNDIQEKIFNIGSQSVSIDSITDTMSNVYDKDKKYDNITNISSIQVEEIRLRVPNESDPTNPYVYIFKYDNVNKVLSVKLEDGDIDNIIMVGKDEKILSKNVESFGITLLDYQSYQNEVDESKKELYTIGKAPGFKVEVTLKKKKGYAENTDKFSSIIKFRNEGK